MPRSFDPAPAPEQAVEAFRAGRVVLSCEEPGRATTPVHVALPSRVTGWACAPAGIDHVIVAVDGTGYSAHYGLPRPDVAHLLDDEGAAGCGFLMGLNDAVLGPGPHEVTIVAVALDGQAAGIRFEVVAGASPARGTLDNGGERFVPEIHGATLIEAEHRARYNWVTALAADRDVLDAGCGVGWGSEVLARAGARRVLGVDIDERAIADASRRSGDAAEFIVGDLSALPLEPKQFDLVVCFEAIEHVPAPDRAIAELRRVLRDDGVLALSSPNRGVYAPGNQFHLRELTSDELEQELRRHFANVAIYRQHTYGGSLLGDDATLRRDDPVKPLDALLYKLSALEPGQELYTVGLAGDRRLPAMRPVAAFSEPVEYRQLNEELFALRQRLAEAQAGASASAQDADRARAELAAAVDARGTAEQSLDTLRASLSWRLTRPLRIAKQRLLDGRRR
jgi:SAM-dependent methyltransferase